MPRGSFGLELSQPDPEDQASAEQLADVLVRLTKATESAGKNDESFAFALEDVSPRVVQRLKEFFKVAADSKARMRVVSGDLESDLSEAAVAQAFERVSLADTQEQVLELRGVFRGATLDTGRFDFRTEAGEQLTGRMAEEISEDEALELVRLTDQSCIAKMRRTSITTRGSILRTRHELIGLRSAS